MHLGFWENIEVFFFLGGFCLYFHFIKVNPPTITWESYSESHMKKKSETCIKIKKKTSKGLDDIQISLNWVIAWLLNNCTVKSIHYWYFSFLQLSQYEQKTVWPCIALHCRQENLKITYLFYHIFCICCEWFTTDHTI